MTINCESVQAILAEEGLEALRTSPEAHRHLNDCEECYQFLLALRELETQLATMPTIAPPAQIVERTLERVALNNERQDDSETHSRMTSTPQNSPSQRDLETESPKTPEPSPGPQLRGLRKEATEVASTLGAWWSRALRALFENPRLAAGVLIGVLLLVIVPLLGLFAIHTKRHDSYQHSAERSPTPTSYRTHQESAGSLVSEEKYSFEEFDEDEQRGDYLSRHEMAVAMDDGILTPMSERAADDHRAAWDEPQERRSRREAAPRPPPAASPTPTPVGDRREGRFASGEAIATRALEDRPTMPDAAPVASVTAYRQAESDLFDSEILPAGVGDLGLAGSGAGGRGVQPGYYAPPSESPLLTGRGDADGDYGRQPSLPVDRSIVTRDQGLHQSFHGAVGSSSASIAQTLEPGLSRGPQVQQSSRRIQASPEVADGLLGSPDPMSSLEYFTLVTEEQSWADWNGYPLQVVSPDEPRQQVVMRRATREDRTLARSFLEERTRTTGLRFQEPSGYWANTYIPGDPWIRQLQRRLLAHHASVDSRFDAFSVATITGRYFQPFDAPRSSALMVYLAADKQSVRGESRLLVQVGIQGTERQSGRRPAMNIAVVLDLEQMPDSLGATTMQSLLMALSEAARFGDRFSLRVAGRPGGMLIEPGVFRYGEVSVASGQLFGGDPPSARSAQQVTWNLIQAYQEAAESLAGSDDPDAPMGSSLIIVVTPRRLDRQVDTLEVLAHDNAVAFGIPTTVIGVGSLPDPEQLDRIALAGQGNRRFMASTADAQEVVSREITSLSRIVARAVRLRIRLGQGVQLIDVLGSHRLDEARAERVRQAEQAIDVRLSRSLGIQADRGEDEDGIQIVIPAFHAGDSHVILLDCVVSGPGHVADVQVRYKDLVTLSNGVARNTLFVDGRERQPGALQHNVIRNLVAFHLSEQLQVAASELSRGDSYGAQNTILHATSLLRGLQHEYQGFVSAPEIERNLEMLSAYLLLLNPRAALLAESELIDSLRYAGYLQVSSPPPMSE